MAKFIKQTFGNENKIFAQEELGFISSISRAQNSTTNSQTLGRNGEKIFKKFLERHLPNCFRLINGHFVTRDGKLSPENDLILIDSRYPLLSENEDGSAIVMLDSVLAIIGLKLKLTKKEINTLIKHSKKNSELLEPYLKENNVFIPQYEFAYSTNIKLETIEKHFFNQWDTNPHAINLHIMRILETDQNHTKNFVGAELWFEPSINDVLEPAEITTKSPLSDFYYRLLQNGFYTLDMKGDEFVNIGENLNKYLTWGTFPNLAKK